MFILNTTIAIVFSRNLGAKNTKNDSYGVSVRNVSVNGQIVSVQADKQMFLVKTNVN